jgi:predicted nucleic acid-binding protein
MPQALVADAGPLIALSKLGLLHQLPLVFSRLTMPHIVLLEATAKGRPGDAQILQFVGEHASFVNIAPTAQSLLVDELRVLLDDGEVQAIHWAHNLGCPVFIDEQRGRKYAAEHGVQVFGTSGFLVRCK